MLIKNIEIVESDIQRIWLVGRLAMQHAELQKGAEANPELDGFSAYELLGRLYAIRTIGWSKFYKACKVELQGFKITHLLITNSFEYPWALNLTPRTKTSQNSASWAAQITSYQDLEMILTKNEKLKALLFPSFSRHGQRLELASHGMWSATASVTDSGLLFDIKERQQ